MRKVSEYKCTFCGKKYKEFGGYARHIHLDHNEEIPKGFTDLQFFYFTQTGRTHGSCIMCHKDTIWNESNGKYNRFCSNPKCKQEYREMFKQRMIGKYGKVHLLNDAEKQKDMLAHRRISGEYTFKDKGTITYTGTYEKDFLEMLDNYMNYSSVDILGPSPHIYYYEYINPKDKANEGRKFYIPDFYIPSLNLEVEIKDSKNTHHKIIDIDRVKEVQKDKLMFSLPNVNYIKILDKNYEPFKKLVEDIKNNNINKAIKYDGKDLSFVSPVTESFEENAITLATESLVFSKDDIYINYQSWGKSPETNLLFVTGLSGSGKTTISKEIAKSHNKIIVWKIDDIYDGNFKKYFDKVPGYKELYKKVQGIDYLNNWIDNVYGVSQKTLEMLENITNEVIKFLTIYASKNFKKYKFIVEGIQIFEDCDFDLVYGKPIIIKGTSALASYIRRKLRNRKNDSFVSINDEIYFFIDYYINADKKLSDFTKDMWKNRLK